jgi:hypothetical protein
MEKRIIVYELNLALAIDQKKFETRDNSGDSLRATHKIFLKYEYDYAFGEDYSMRTEKIRNI